MTKTNGSKPRTTTSVSFDKDEIDRALLMAESLKQRPEYKYVRLNLPTIMRIAVGVGLDKLEAEQAHKANKSKGTTVRDEGVALRG